VSRDGVTPGSSNPFSVRIPGTYALATVAATLDAELAETRQEISDWLDKKARATHKKPATKKTVAKKKVTSKPGKTDDNHKPVVKTKKGAKQKVGEKDKPAD